MSRKTSKKKVTVGPELPNDAPQRQKAANKSRKNTRQSPEPLAEAPDRPNNESAPAPQANDAPDTSTMEPGDIGTSDTTPEDSAGKDMTVAEALVPDVGCRMCGATANNLRPSGCCSEWCEQEAGASDGRNDAQADKPESAAAPAASIEAEASRRKTSALDAAAKVLGETGRSMNCKELIDAMAAKGYWTSPGGKTPAATLSAGIGKEIATKASGSRFQKTGPGLFTLRG